MGPVNALNAFFFQHFVKQATGAAIAVEHEYGLVLVPVGCGFFRARREQ